MSDLRYVDKTKHRPEILRDFSPAAKRFKRETGKRGQNLRGIDKALEKIDASPVRRRMDGGRDTKKGQTLRLAPPSSKHEHESPSASSIGHGCRPGPDQALDELPMHSSRVHHSQPVTSSNPNYCQPGAFQVGGIERTFDEEEGTVMIGSGPSPSAPEASVISAELVPPERQLPMVSPTQVVTEDCWSRRRNGYLILAVVVVVLCVVVGLVVFLLLRDNSAGTDTPATPFPTTSATDSPIAQTPTPSFTPPPTPAPTRIWTQYGQELVGEASGDTFGRTISLSADGTVLAVGAHYNGNHRGMVTVFGWNGATWIQRGRDLVGTTEKDRFGDSVSLSDDGNVVAIGATQFSATGSPPGYVMVLEWNGGTSSWIQRGPTLNGETTGDRFGWAVSLSADGSVLAVGSNFGKDPIGISTGKLEIFEFHRPSVTWRQRGGSLFGDASGDRFGESLALSADGNVVAVGARLSDPNGALDAGTVKVFQWDGGAASWSRRGQDLYGEAEYAWFGFAVSLSANGNVIAAGSPEDDSEGNGGGKVVVFQWDGGSSSWSQLGQELVGESLGDHFGVGISLSSDGNIVAIGADQYLGPGVSPGYVKVYQIKGDEWQQLGNDLLGGEDDDQFGTSVSLSEDGTVVGAGATQWAHADPDPPGYVRVFQLQD